MAQFNSLSFVVVVVVVASSVYSRVKRLTSDTADSSSSSSSSSNYIVLSYVTPEEETVRYDLAKNPKLHGIVSPLIFTPHKFVLHDQTKTFRLSPSGVLTSVGSLDREKLCPSEPACDLELEVGLHVKDKLKRRLKVAITVEDINDHPPKFESHRLVIDLSEDLEPGHLVPLPRAVDPDGPANDVDKYALVEIGGTRGFFEMQSDEFRDDPDDAGGGGGGGGPGLRLIKSLDRETRDLHRLKLIAYDKGTPSKSGTLLIEIQVEDGNDNHPRFESSHYFAPAILENSDPIASLVQVRADDPDVGDNGIVWYDFTRETRDDYGHLFAINSSTGLVSNVASLDYERTGREIVLEVVAYDLAGNRSSLPARVVVNVEDANDHAPEIRHGIDARESDARFPCLPAVRHEKVDVFPVSVGEFQPSELNRKGTVGRGGGVRIPFSVTDSDGNGNDNNDNNVVSCQILRTSNDSHFRLDYVNESSFQISFPCDGDRCYDGDSGGDGDDIGLLSTLMDREKHDCHFVVVTCSDGGKIPLTTSATFVVSLEDANDNKPRFEFSRHHFVVDSRSVCSGKAIGKFKVIDPDAGDNGRYQLSVANCTRVEYRADDVVTSSRAIKNLNLEGLGDRLRLARRNGRGDEDHDGGGGGGDGGSCEESVVGLHDCLVIARDHGEPRLESSSPAFILVQSRTDTPRPTHDDCLMFVRENRPSFTFVGNIRSCFREENEEQEEQEEEEELDHFQTVGTNSLDVTVDRTTGDVHSLVPLDYELKRNYLLNVLAGHGSTTREMAVRVHVLDENDNSPAILFPMEGDVVQAFGRARAAESPVCDIVAVDHDDGSNGLLVYKIVEEEEGGPGRTSGRMFRLNSTTGKLTFISRGDDDGRDGETGKKEKEEEEEEEEEEVSHVLTVAVLDNGDPVRQAGVTFTVSIRWHAPPILLRSTVSGTNRYAPASFSMTSLSTTAIMALSSLFGVTIFVIVLLCWAVFSKNTVKSRTKETEAKKAEERNNSKQQQQQQQQQQHLPVDKMSDDVECSFQKTGSILSDFDVRFCDTLTSRLASPIVLHMSSSVGHSDICYQCNPTFWTPQMARTSLNQDDAKLIQKLDNYWTLQKTSRVLEEQRASKFSPSYFPVAFTK